MILNLKILKTKRFKERTIDMDNLKIYIDTTDLIKVKGKMRDLKEGELIQARLMKSNLMLSITDNPELFNSKFEEE